MVREFDKASEIDDPGLRNFALSTIQKEWRGDDGLPVISDEVLAGITKTGDGQRRILLNLIGRYGGDVLDGLSDDEKTTAFRKPIEFLKYLDTLNQTEQSSAKRQAQVAEQDVYAQLDLTGPAHQQLANVTMAIQQGQARGADMGRAITLRNSILSQMSQEDQEAYRQQQAGFERQRLGMQGAGLAETRRHHGALEAWAARWKINTRRARAIPASARRLKMSRRRSCAPPKGGRRGFRKPRSARCRRPARRDVDAAK